MTPGALHDAIAAALLKGIRPEEVAHRLNKQGMDEQLAVVQVVHVQSKLEGTPQWKEAMIQRYTRRMRRGVIVAFIGAGITLITYSAATGGGTYVIAGGAIFFGVLDFLVGLVGYLKQKVTK